jgi:hypothetical protein
MNDRVQQQTLHVDENMSFLAFDQFARIERSTKVGDGMKG